MHTLIKLFVEYSRDAKKKAQKISIPKNKGLGINIGVGKSSSVLVTKIVPGMDVHQVRYYIDLL